jgi:hypothetical protein
VLCLLLFNGINTSLTEPPGLEDAKPVLSALWEAWLPSVGSDRSAAKDQRQGFTTACKFDRGFCFHVLIVARLQNLVLTLFCNTAKIFC